jgi:hypothetical protein
MSPFRVITARLRRGGVRSPKLVPEVGTEPPSDEQPVGVRSSVPVVEVAQCGVVNEVDGLAYVIVGGQAGRYLITDGQGQQLGVIRGDYVVGFTVTVPQWNLHRRFGDLAGAHAAIGAEAKARATGHLSAAS